MSDPVDGVRFLVRLPQAYCSADPGAILQVADLAENLGFYGVSVQDHLVADSTVSPCGEDHRQGGDDRNVFEALQTLAFVGAHTERVRLVTGVIVLPMRHPVWLAKEVACLDVISSGRVILGVGVGASPGRRRSDEASQGVSPHARIAEIEYDAVAGRGFHRGKLSNEAIEVIQCLWGEDVATYSGEYFSIEGLDMVPKPFQPGGPPMWMGGRSEAARRRAVRYGVGWFPSQISAEHYRDGVRSLREIAAAERRQTPPVLGVNIFAVLSTTDQAARLKAERAFGDRFTAQGLATVILAGSPETVRGQIQAFVDVGVNTFDLKILPPTLEGVTTAMEVFASEVVPAVDIRRLGDIDGEDT